jgi:acetylornithine deacetylase/succinyl-diaminopimelate desuccinylase-like protein
MEHTLPHQVLTHGDQAAMVELASALVRIPSFKTEETPVAQVLADFFRPRGYQVDLQEPELLRALRRYRKQSRGDDAWASVSRWVTPVLAPPWRSHLRGAWPRGTRKASCV